MACEHIHFVTGRLAEFSLRRVLKSLAAEVGFEFTIDVLPITVAALMTPEWIASRISLPKSTTRVLLPGYCHGDLAPVVRAAGVSVELGPRDLRRMAEMFGRGAALPEGYGRHDIEIIAEINHCPRLSLDDILTEADRLRAAGADVIDVGCDPGDAWSGVSDAVKALKDAGHRVSIDSLNPAEIAPAVRSGAELVLSVNATNLDAAVDWGCEVVVVPDEIDTLGGLEETLGPLTGAGVPVRIDPVLEPIGLGFAASLGRYLEVRRRYPDAEMMMGIGNLTELTDVDSAGINVLLLGFCQESGIRSVLTTQVINWARSSVRECDLARRLVFHAAANKTPPKHLEPRLVTLRDADVPRFGTLAIEQLAGEIKDNNYRIFAEDEELHLVSAKMHLRGADPFELMQQLLDRQPKNLDAAHAFYLGYEMCKAVTALTLGKDYQQDEALDWGHLTRQEVSHRLKPGGKKGISPIVSHEDGRLPQRPTAKQLDLSPFFPLVEEITPAPEAVDVFRRLCGLPGCLFLDSALRHEELGRYSFVAADPFDFVTVAADTDEPLRCLDRWRATFHAASAPGLPPFQGGAAGLFGYELCRSFERLPKPRFDEFQAPALAVGLYDVVVAFDHQTGRAWIISHGFPETDPGRRQRRAKERLRDFRRLIERASPAEPICAVNPQVELSSSRLSPQFPAGKIDGLTSDFSRKGYLDAVTRGIEYVHAGDVFQVNLSQRLLCRARDDSVSLYLRLRERNPATFAGYFDAGDCQIISASPERFLQVRDGHVEARPIKGTRGRIARPEADLFGGDDLRQSEKDRAENIMIVDLMRNDLSRVCRPESVHVSQLCGLEVYQYVQHLVSAVRGRLKEGLTPLDLLRVALPGGSVTGAPKVRAMEIIAELEPTARGPYCGSLGYLGFDGSMDTSILIRTVTASRGWWQLPVGGGIVAQSVPEREYEETWQKAEGMLRAL